jgi:hypothetical protein
LLQALRDRLFRFLGRHPEVAMKIVSTHISILNFTYKPLDARFHQCLCRFERDEDVLEVETQWVRARTSHFSYRDQTHFAKRRTVSLPPSRANP